MLSNILMKNRNVHQLNKKSWTRPAHGNDAVLKIISNLDDASRFGLKTLWDQG